MFGRKKKSALVAYVDDSRSLVRDFRRRQVFESYRTVDYGICEKMQEKQVYAMLDRCLERLLPGADECNQNMLNSKLLAIGLQGVEDLKRQRISHRDTIHRLAARRTADCADIRQMLENEQAGLEALLKEHEKTCRLLTQYEKGAERNENQTNL